MGRVVKIVEMIVLLSVVTVGPTSLARRHAYVVNALIVGKRGRREHLILLGVDPGPSFHSRSTNGVACSILHSLTKAGVLSEPKSTEFSKLTVRREALSSVTLGEDPLLKVVRFRSPMTFEKASIGTVSCSFLEGSHLVMRDAPT